MLELGRKEKPSFNYTGYSWEGKNYGLWNSKKELASIVRQDLKERYPSARFSISTAGYNNLTVGLIAWDKNPFNGEVKDYGQWHRNESDFSEEGVELLKTVTAVLQSLNYDDSDVMTDYFSCGFYGEVSIGTWQHPFVLKTKK